MSDTRMSEGPKCGIMKAPVFIDSLHRTAEKIPDWFGYKDESDDFRAYKWRDYQGEKAGMCDVIRLLSNKKWSLDYDDNGLLPEPKINPNCPDAKLSSTNNYDDMPELEPINKK